VPKVLLKKGVKAAAQTAGADLVETKPDR